MKRIMLLFYIVAPILIMAEGKPATPRPVVAFKVDQTTITLDGKLDESVWQNTPISSFTQRDPNEGSPASENTNAWIAYDNNYIYVTAHCFDSKPELIDRSIARKDNYYLSDWFIFYVDPYNDKKTGFYFGVNAGGTRMDGTLFNDSWDDDSWEGVWEAATSIDEKGWSVEMRIPFSQMRFKEANEMTWGINFAREIQRNNERSYYVMVPKKESGFVSRFAELDGIKGVQPKQRFEVLPYVVQKAQYLKHDDADPFYKSNQYRTTLGADLKIGIGSNLNIDATINPDFGQVEVDPAVINLTAFESYFQEKRPFFVEGATTFYFGVGGVNNNWGFNFGWPELFYSRRIGRSPHGNTSSADYVNYPTETKILGAAKLTGKLDETTSISAVSAVTERSYANLFTGGIKTEEEVEPLTHYGVFRTKKEFNDGRQSLGLMFTTVNRSMDYDSLKTSLAKNAFTFGLDGYTFLDKDKEYVLAGAFSGSYVQGSKQYLQLLQQKPYRYYQRPDATFETLDSSRTSLSGYYGRLMLNKQSGNFYINSALGIISPGFEFNDLGFQQFADRINFHTVLGYRWFEPDGFFRKKNIYLAYSRSFNFEGLPISNFLYVDSYYQFMNFWSLEFYGNYNFETYNFTTTRGGPIIKSPASYYFGIYVSSDSKEKIIVSFEPDHSENKLGYNYNAYYANIQWKPSPQLSLSIGPSFENKSDPRQWVDNFSDPTAVNTYGNRYVFASLEQQTIAANIRLNWTFSPTLSLQLFLQPFISVGHYRDFKEVAKPRTLDLNTYGQNGSTLSYDAAAGEYTVDPDGNGPAQSFQISNPDFNYKSLRGNAVLRWEAMPGSIFYFVWSRSQTNSDDVGNLSFGRDFKNLWRADGDNVFLVKFSYWFNM
jgi:hypothetical protein